MQKKKRKRAVDLSVEELAALGEKAARSAAQKAHQNGLVVTGTVESYERGTLRASLAQLHPSGTVTFLERSDRSLINEKSPTAEATRRRKSED